MILRTVYRQAHRVYSLVFTPVAGVINHICVDFQLLPGTYSRIHKKSKAFCQHRRLRSLQCLAQIDVYLCTHDAQLTSWLPSYYPIYPCGL